MLDFLFLIFTYISESLIVYAYSNALYKVKRSKWLSITGTISTYLTLLLIYYFALNNEILNSLLIVIVNIGIIKHFFDSTLKSAIFHGIILCIVQYVSEFLSLFALSLSLNVSTSEIVSEHFETGTIISRIIYFLITVFIAKISYRENNNSSWGKWCSLSILPLGSMFTIISIRILTKDAILSTYQNTLCMVTVSVLMLINIIIYFIYEESEKNNQKLLEFELLEQKNQIDLNYLSLLEKKNEAIQVMSHDINKHLSTLKVLSSIEDIKDYIDNLHITFSAESSIPFTHNKILDVVLNKYKVICDEEQISLDINVLSDNFSFMQNIDISALFNNLFDNAIEATKKSNEKHIMLDLYKSNNSFHILSLENSCSVKPQSDGKKLFSLKNDPTNHGYGTKSILKVVQKYNGEMQWIYDEDIQTFKITIIIPFE